jgi:uncharacterized membrane protein
MPNVDWKSKKIRSEVIILLILSGLMIVWILLTPAGFIGKLNAIGFSVCTQDLAHTLSLEGHFLPLCSRCTGMYLGTFIALAWLLKGKRAMNFPSTGKWVVLLLLFLLFVVDGINSTVAVLVPKFLLYPPTNTLRLFSGLGMGVVIANVILPLWNQTFWAQGSPESCLASWGQMAGLLLTEGAAGVVIYWGGDWFYYPVAVLSIGMVPLLITMVYTLLGMIFFKRENVVHHFHEGIVYIGAGAIFALLQIGMLDLVHYLLQGGWVV